MNVCAYQKPADIILGYHMTMSHRDQTRVVTKPPVALLVLDEIFSSEKKIALMSFLARFLTLLSIFLAFSYLDAMVVANMN